jgi:salicylate hydroxylase
MYDDFKDWDPRLIELLRAIKTPDQWSMWHLPHDQRYYSGRVCLLGDAAHAALPHLGSGAGMAIEDGYILGNLIAGWAHKGDFGVPFKAYDAMRRPRTQELVRKSQESGHKHFLVLPGVLDDPVTLREYSKDEFQWIWNHDLESELRDAWYIACGIADEVEGK